MISRFRTPKEQKLILEKLEAGQIDILIGTHRLLSKDLKFQDIGLLVVDEEQRFGVRHKERLKQLRQQIDVLSMSATPIPRTLHMSLVGLRDMSVIETPPKDRMAIQTVVAKFDEKLIRTAVELELERGGQVYFVHNRVETIYELAAKIQELVPQSRVVVGHGQMGEAELEKTLLAFMNHEYRRLRRHHHHRERHRHSAREHHHRESRRPPRPLRALPVAWPRRPLQSPRVCLSADPS